MTTHATPEILAGHLAEWPFPIMAAHPAAWVEISETHADYCLEVLPPHYYAGGFAVSEASHSTPEGEPVYVCVVTAGARYFARHLPLSRASVEAARLRAAVKP